MYRQRARYVISILFEVTHEFHRHLISPDIFIVGPKAFFSVRPTCPKSAQIQRFVSSTRNIEVLLSHTHSIVCDNDIGGLFLGCSKSCKMAAHNLKIHFNSLFMILHKKVSKMFRRVFLLIKEICFVIQIHEFLQSLTQTNILFQFERTVHNLSHPNFLM